MKQEGKIGKDGHSMGVCNSSNEKASKKREKYKP
jgi:hypothetical protein